MTHDLALWAEIDLQAIRDNVKALKGLLAPETKFLAVVKANGYGHGDAQVAKAAIEAGADWLAVARVHEGESLRRAGIKAPVLLLAEPPAEALQQVVDLGLTPTIYTQDMAEALSRLDHPETSVHVKVDTGMHRYGALPDEIMPLIESIQKLDGVSVTGIWSHFAVADDVLNPYTKHQHAVFMDVLEKIGPQAGGWLKHLSNSAGTLSFPEAHFDMVRAGIAIYGIPPSPDLSDRVELRPAMSVKSRVGLTKRLQAGESISYGQRYTLSSDAVVATIPVGYADGMRRALTNKGALLIRGRRYEICGTVTMDHVLTDVGDDHAEVGDEVVLLGTQGQETISAGEIAQMLDTIPYEIVCGINSRVPRVYIGSSDG